MICVQIKLSYLPVGHTHEDIDQLFSVISRILKNKDVLSLTDFRHLIARAYRRRGSSLRTVVLRKVYIMFDSVFYCYFQTVVVIMWALYGIVNHKTKIFNIFTRDTNRKKISY